MKVVIAMGVFQRRRNYIVVAFALGVVIMISIALSSRWWLVKLPGPSLLRQKAIVSIKYFDVNAWIGSVDERRDGKLVGVLREEAGEWQVAEISSSGEVSNRLGVKGPGQIRAVNDGVTVFSESGMGHGFSRCYLETSRRLVETLSLNGSPVFAEGPGGRFIVAVGREIWIDGLSPGQFQWIWSAPSGYLAAIRADGANIFAGVIADQDGVEERGLSIFCLSNGGVIETQRLKLHNCAHDRDLWLLADNDIVYRADNLVGRRRYIRVSPNRGEVVQSGELYMPGVKWERVWRNLLVIVTDMEVRIVDPTTWETCGCLRCSIDGARFVGSSLSLTSSRFYVVEAGRQDVEEPVSRIHVIERK